MLVYNIVLLDRKKRHVSVKGNVLGCDFNHQPKKESVEHPQQAHHKKTTCIFRPQKNGFLWFANEIVFFGMELGGWPLRNFLEKWHFFHSETA